MGRIAGGSFEKPRQHGGFRKVHIAHRFAKIELRCRLHPIIAAAEIGAIEIELEDVILAEPRLDPEGEEHFVDFAPKRAFGRQEKVLGKLLGERGAALTDFAILGIFDKGAQGADEIDAEMVVKTGILGGQHRLDENRGNLADGDVVILPNAAPAHDMAGSIREGDGIFAPLVPDVTFPLKWWQGEDEKADADGKAEGERIIRDIGKDPKKAIKA